MALMPPGYDIKSLVGHIYIGEEIGKVCVARQAGISMRAQEPSRRVHRQAPKLVI